MLENHRKVARPPLFCEPKKNSGKIFELLFFALLVSLIVPGCGKSGSQEHREAFRRAVETFEKAENMGPEVVYTGTAFPEFPGEKEGNSDEEIKNPLESLEEKRRMEFRKVAAIYQGLIENGIESGPIHYNQGNAWVRAEEPARALAAYRLAERFMPRNPYLKSNLQFLAISDANPEECSPVPYLFFWQNQISYPWKLRISLFFVLSTFLCAMFALLCNHRKARNGAVVLLAFTVISLSSSFYDWYRFESMQHGVILYGETVARKGNSSQYEPSFVDPLKSCCEFTVKDERGDWVQIRLSGGETGWIRKDQAVFY